jgi:hypothetical protein
MAYMGIGLGTRWVINAIVIMRLRAHTSISDPSSQIKIISPYLLDVCACTYIVWRVCMCGYVHMCTLYNTIAIASIL